MELIEFKGRYYPQFQSTGFASRFAFPYAEEVCKGNGFDIGSGRKEWALKGAIPIDVNFQDGFDAFSLPEGEVDYIFSSHCLEHLNNWVDVLDYWTSKIKSGGLLFLYLPHPEQEYWLPWNNRKHKNIFYPITIKQYLESNGYHKIFISGMDLNHSFMSMAEKL
jgi:SAM-dependent methyltransferase